MMTVLIEYSIARTGEDVAAARRDVKAAAKNDGSGSNDDSAAVIAMAVATMMTVLQWQR